MRGKGDYDFDIYALPRRVLERADEDTMMELLTYHAEKKALAVELALGKQKPFIVLNTKMCGDCHNYFLAVSREFSIPIKCRDGSNVLHIFEDGECVCNGNWR